MFKYAFIIFWIIVISGCQQLTRGQLQPVTVRNGNYVTNCGGAVEGWGTCYSKASITCPNGYNVLLKDEGNTGILRELTFSCKK